MISEAPSLATSPRISFSHNLSATNVNILHNPQVQEPVPSSSEFDFCISNTETSSADELFSDGVIRPIQLQEKFVNSSKQIPLSKKTQTLGNSLPPLPQNDQNDQTPKQEIKSEQQKNHSFWGIKRSSSVNAHKKSSSFWSLPSLSRSNSTGSVPNSKKQGTLQLKQIKNSSAAAGPASFYTFPSSQKPPLRKNYGAGGTNYGNGIRVSPVLNVASQNLFGFGSLFRNGKYKKSKK